MAWEKRLREKLEDIPLYPGIRLGYSHERNFSNDSLYDYSANVFSVQITGWF